MLSLKSMRICSHIRTQLLDILSVHSFHIETVALLEKVEPRLKTILYTYVFTVNSKYDCISILTRFDTSSL